MSEAGSLVTAEWLEAYLDDPGVRVVETTWYLPTDGRSGRAEYESGHIRGAAYWDIDGIADPDDPRPHMRPRPPNSPRRWASSASAIRPAWSSTTGWG